MLADCWKITCLSSTLPENSFIELLPNTLPARLDMILNSLLFLAIRNNLKIAGNCINCMKLFATKMFNAINAPISSSPLNTKITDEKMVKAISIFESTILTSL